MAIQNNFPAISPSLSLDFANVGALDPRITYARASAATYYGTETAKAEENLLIRSQEFDNNSFWSTNSNTVSFTANTTAAPNGTTTAETLTAAVGTSTKLGSPASIYAVTSGLAYTSSLFVQAGTDTVVQLVFSGATFGANAFANFDLSAGTVGSVGSSATATISSAGGTWYRCSITATATASSTASLVAGFAFTGNNSSAARLPSITAVGTETLIIWGAQLEQRSAVTSYTPTTDQPITNYIPVLESAASGEARFDHNPNTFESLGLLIEESRTNLVTYSEEFEDAAWNKVRSSITANTIVAPDGTLTGDKLVEDTTANNSHTVLRATGVTIAANTAQTFSAYIKAAGRTRCSVNLFNSAFTSGARSDVNLSTGTITTEAVGTATNVSASITNVGNGWFRCTITATVDSSSTTANVQIALRDNSSNVFYTGDGFSGIFIWGASLEQGAFPTSYIPTTTAQVTRAADAASMTGANFSSWFGGASEGSVYTEASSFGLVSTAADDRRHFFAFQNEAASTLIFVAAITSGVITVSRAYQDSFTTSGGSGVTTLTSGQSIKYATAFDSSTIRRVTNTVTGTDIVRQMNSGDFSELQIGRTNTVRFLNGTMKKLAFYPKALTAAELQSLTG